MADYSGPADWELEKHQPILRYLRRIEEVVRDTQWRSGGTDRITEKLGVIAENQVQVGVASTNYFALQIMLHSFWNVVLIVILAAHVWHHW